METESRCPLEHEESVLVPARTRYRYTTLPGSFTDETLKYALENWPGAAIGGFADGTVGGEGWCVLVDGDEAMEDAERMSKRQVGRDQSNVSAS